MSGDRRNHHHGPAGSIPRFPRVIASDGFLHTAVSFALRFPPVGSPALLLASIIALSTGSLAQVAPTPDAAKPADQSTISTFVPDSSVAMERLTLADKLAQAGEWAKSAEIYQELLENYRDRVVPASADDPTLYRNVTDRVLRQLAQWPADGLAVYNGRYQPAAQTLLAQADSPEALRAITDRYLLTRAGVAAAGRLLQQWWDQGQTGTAAQFAEHIASLLPDDHPQRPPLLFESGLCWLLAGNPDRARAIAATLHDRYAQVHQTIAGRDMSVADALEQAITLAASAKPAVAPADSWRAFGGSPQRSMVPSGQGRPDALLFAVDLVSPARSDGQFPSPRIPVGMLRQQARNDLNQALAIMPVYDNGELFFQDGTNLYGVSLDGGMKLPEWPGLSVPIAPASPAIFGPSLRTLAVTDDSIVTVQSDLVLFAQMIQVAADVRADTSALTCFDRRNGKLRWRVTPSRLAGAAAALKSVQFASPPLTVGSRVFVAARGGRNAQLNDIYVLCFDLADGKLLWSSYVASGPSMNMGFMDGIPGQTETGLPQLSWNAGRVVILTNVGAIASLDAANGLPAWLRVYARNEQPSMRFMAARFARPVSQSDTPRIFAASPAAIAAGHIFALPVDATALLVLDEADGQVIKRIPLSSLGSVDMLIGLRGRQLVVAGERIATALDWQTANEAASQQTDAIDWTMDFPGAALRGRPFLTTDSLFLATDDRLLRVATEHWKIEQTMPRAPTTWATDQGPGNILVTGEQVVVATAKQVNVYTNLAAITARYDRDIADNPTAPEPLVRYGELLFTAGQNDMALARFKSALALVVSPTAKPEMRDRLFSAALSCAQRLSSADSANQSSLAFLDLARTAAGSPVQQVQYHIAAASRAQRANDGPSAMAHMQEILDDPRQRAATVRDIDQSLRLASIIARRTVAQLIDRYGTAIYQPSELSMQKQLAAAQDARDPSALMELYRRYPNSPDAPSAVFAAGRLYEDQQKPADAATAYRILIQENPTHADAAAFFEAFARAYAALPGKAHIAAARLAQASLALNDPATTTTIRLPDGQAIQPGRFSQVALALKQAAGVQPGHSLPDLQLPPSGTSAYTRSQQVDLQADRILPPTPGTRPDYQRCVLLTRDQSVAILEPAGKIVARIPATAIIGPVDVAWASPAILLVRSRNQLSALDIAASKILWSITLDKLPSLPQLDADAEPVDDAQVDAVPEVRIQIQQQMRMANLQIAVRVGNPQPDANAPGTDVSALALVAGKVVFGTTTGRLVAARVEDGSILWQAQLGQGSIGRVDACDDFAAARLDSPQLSRLTAIDMTTGTSVFGRTASNLNPIHNLVVTSDSRLMFTLGNRLLCKDLFDQSERMLFETGLGENAMGFYGQNAPDQLLATDDAIVAVADAGMSIRMFSPITGRQIIPGGRDSAGRPALSLLANNGPGPQFRQARAHLVPAEPYVYIYSQGLVRALNVQRPEPADRMLPGQGGGQIANIGPVVPGLMHLVALEQPFRQGNANAQPASSISIYAFSRLQGAKSESGRLEQAVTLKQESGVTSCQLVEGGLYLTTGDSHLIYYFANR